MDQLPRRVLYYGRDEALPERRELRAGPLSVIFEGGDLRYVRLGEREILRRVYVAVRDRNWDTILPSYENVTVDAGERTFRIRFDCVNHRGGIDFAWTGTIAGAANGTIEYRMDGIVRSTFLKNRIGICVLHPARECAGAAYRASRVDGAVETGTLPVLISPHQPVKDLAGFAHEVAPRLWADVRFTGDVFEMEDQRNWTDASFKTYSTPLARPYPVEVTAGTRISQSITLTLQGALPDRANVEPVPRLTIDRSAAAVALPRLGLGSASHGQPLQAGEIARLRALNLHHLRVDLRLAEPSFAAVLRQARESAGLLGVGLEVALYLGERAEEQLRALRAVVDEVQPPVATWLVYRTGESITSSRWIDLARQALSEYSRAARFGAGTDNDFTELNRRRPEADGRDIVVYAVNPQVHAFDNSSIVETLETQATTVASGRAFAHGKPIAISPITLKQRFNPVAVGPAASTPPDELPAPVDSRQMSLLGAGWTMGSLKYLAASGIASATYYETTGWRGVMELAAGSPLPALFRSIPGGVFPLYHVLADVGEFAGGAALPTLASQPLVVDGMALVRDGRTRVLVANLTADLARVRIGGLVGTVRVRRLDETNVDLAMREPEAHRAALGELVAPINGELELELLSFGLARIDGSDAI